MWNTIKEDQTSVLSHFPEIFNAGNMADINYLNFPQKPLQKTQIRMWEKNKRELSIKFSQ